MFICRHCPYVQHVKKELARIGKDYQKKVLRSSRSAQMSKNYPDDSPENLKKMALQECFDFPFCYDETQEVAKKYSAALHTRFFPV